MNESTEKTHTCIRCGSYRSALYEIRGKIMIVCRQIERASSPSKAAEFKAKLADLKERLRVQKEWYQEHLDEVLYSPTAS